jgi:hypothetical protein
VQSRIVKLEIIQALWEGRLLPPKTAGSVRAVYFGHGLSMALKVQRHYSMYTAPEHFVFCKPDGSSLNPDVLRRDVLYPVPGPTRYPAHFPCRGISHVPAFGRQYHQPSNPPMPDCSKISTRPITYLTLIEIRSNPSHHK